jgi:uncharacterized DUF497 family protein
VQFKCDPKKNRANRKKHGLSLGFAAELDWNQMVLQVQHPEGEERWFGLAPSGGRLYAIAFTTDDAGDEELIRPISLRRATNQEKDDYVSQKGIKK